MKKFDDTYTAYALGFLAGFHASKDDVNKKVREMDKLLKGEDTVTISAGIIHRPTAQQLRDREVPKHIKEGREEMKKALDQIPELQEQKALLKKLEEQNP